MNVRPAIVSVPVRAAPAFAATENDTAPSPVPAPPPVIVIHAAFDVAVHPQVWMFAITPTPPLPPAAANPALRDASASSHGTAAWSTVNVRPAIVIVPLRASPALAATENETVPSPVPAAPPMTVIQAAFDTAVQPQEARLESTSTLPGPPTAGSAAPGALSSKAHGASA